MRGGACARGAVHRWATVAVARGQAGAASRILLSRAAGADKYVGEEGDNK